MRRPMLTLLICGSAAAVALGAGWAASGVVEARIAERVARLAEAQGHDWVAARVDGLTLTLAGAAPDAEAAASARLALGPAAAPARVIDLIAVDAPPRRPDPSAAEAPAGGEYAAEPVAASGSAAGPKRGSEARGEAGAAGPFSGPHPDAPARDAGPWLRAALADGRVTIKGAAPDEATRAAVRSYAAAAFGAAQVDGALTLGAGPAPGWGAAALAALDGLALLRAGEAAAAGRRLTLAGEAADHETAPRLAALAPPEGWEAALDVVVPPPPPPGLAPDACAEALAAVVAETPVQFAPGSAEIDPESGPVLDALARTLAGCRPDAIEIGGHTDSQGSEGYNRRLSQERAEAVREALLERGAAPARLRAAGYGESRPVADNASEAGRARNRRIAFEPAPDAPEPDG